ncbi:MAG: hypothetical protein ACTHW2_02490 [Tissierella sp.]|uniref:hypothetical protein n=1 Tax=Tissierella sp. TaxID=41274 RepID=UPI003F985E07
MINEKFIINLQGKSFVTYEGLLDLAHNMGLLSIDVELLQFPSEANNMTAVIKAIARTKDSSFSDIGDASPRSVNNMLAPHIIRMASTRAKARALRDLTNVGMTAVEELTSEDDVETKETQYHVEESLQKEAPTKRQIETIKKLAEDLNQQVNYDSLTKKTAGTLIGRLLDEKKK